MYSTPTEYIGIPCQEEEFNLELLAEMLENSHDLDKPQMQELERIPLIRKITAPADVMDLEEIEHHIFQYCKLWALYADTSIQLKKASKLPQEEAVTACKIYGTHILEVLKKFDEITKLFAIENELRIIRCRELLPFPTTSPHKEKIENKNDKDKVLHEVDEEVMEMLKETKKSKRDWQEKQTET